MAGFGRQNLHFNRNEKRKKGQAHALGSFSPLSSRWGAPCSLKPHNRRCVTFFLCDSFGMVLGEGRGERRKKTLLVCLTSFADPDVFEVNGSGLDVDCSAVNCSRMPDSTHIYFFSRRSVVFTHVLENRLSFARKGQVVDGMPVFPTFAVGATVSGCPFWGHFGCISSCSNEFRREHTTKKEKDERMKRQNCLRSDWNSFDRVNLARTCNCDLGGPRSTGFLESYPRVAGRNDFIARCFVGNMHLKVCEIKTLTTVSSR